MGGGGGCSGGGDDGGHDGGDDGGNHGGNHGGSDGGSDGETSIAQTVWRSVVQTSQTSGKGIPPVLVGLFNKPPPKDSCARLAPLFCPQPERHLSAPLAPPFGAR